MENWRDNSTRKFETIRNIFIIYIHKYILGGFNQLLLTCILPNLILFRVLHPTIIYGKHRNLTAEKYVCLELGKSWLDDKIICGKALKAESKSNHIWQHWNSLNKYLKTCLTIQTNTNVLCKIWNVQVLLNQQKLEKIYFRNIFFSKQQKSQIYFERV